MGWVLFGCSLALLALSCRAVVVAMRARGWDRFWVWLMVFPSELGLAAIVTSAFHAFEAIPFLIAQGGVTGLCWVFALRRRGGPVESPVQGTAARRAADPVLVVLGLLVGVLLIISVTEAQLNGIADYDERMYHAPRAIYWLQHKSVFFFTTNNDRQVAFPYGAELVFAWPLLFVRLEGLGHLCHWLAVPAGAAGVASICSLLGTNRRGALAGAMLYLATPALLTLGTSLKSDVWQPVYLLGAAYFAIRPERPGRPLWVSFFLAGGFLALAMNVKLTAFGLAPGLALATLVAGRAKGLVPRLIAVAAGAVLFASASGLTATLVSNAKHFGSPIGPAWISRAVKPEYNRRQVYVYAVRTLLYLIEPPQIPSELLRKDVEDFGNTVSHAIRADTKLEGEAPGWPGLFTFNAYIFARRYSLGGMLWLPMLVVGLAGGARQVARSWRRPSLSGAPLLAAVHLPLFAGVVMLIRWMGAGPDRFWIGPYALSIPVGIWYLTGWTLRSGVIAGIALFLFTLTGFSAAQGTMLRLDFGLSHPLSAENRDGRVSEIPPLLPQGCRILFVAGNSVRDYALFDPRHGYCNTVIQWGNAPFDPEKLAGLMKSERIDQVVIENDQAVEFFGVGLLDTTPLVAWLEGRPAFHAVPLKTPHVRLYQRVDDAGQ